MVRLGLRNNELGLKDVFRFAHRPFLAAGWRIVERTANRYSPLCNIVRPFPGRRSATGYQKRVSYVSPLALGLSSTGFSSRMGLSKAADMTDRQASADILSVSLNRRCNERPRALSAGTDSHIAISCSHVTHGPKQSHRVDCPVLHASGIFRGTVRAVFPPARDGLQTDWQRERDPTILSEEHGRPPYGELRGHQYVDTLFTLHSAEEVKRGPRHVDGAL